jgi:hypothetical protein
MELRLHYDVIDQLFKWYNSENFSNRNIFIKKVTKEYAYINENEACVIWQAFDRAAEEWQKTALNLS